MELNPLYRLYVELNEKVEALKSSGVGGSVVSSENNDLTDIIIRLRNLEARPTYETDIFELKSKVAVLENENGDLKQKLSFAMSKMEQLETRIYNLESEPRLDLEPLNQRVSSLETLEVADKITKVETRMSNVEQLSNTITDVSYRLGEVERRPELGERLYAIELALATMVAKPPSNSSSF